MGETLELLKIGLFVALPLLISILSAWHALLFKRDSRSALGWVAICLVLPVIGAILYFLFGINRVRAKAQRQSGKGKRWRVDFERGIRFSPNNQQGNRRESAVQSRKEGEKYPAGIDQAVSRVTGNALLKHNKVNILRNGESAYPAMLSAIDRASKTVLLTTYIFENNETGLNFVRALSEANKRGVAVRVLIDGMGVWYSRGIVKALRKESINVKRFNPLRILFPTQGINLRNHRKILVVDNQIAFTGGMNIGDRHLIKKTNNPKATEDVQFSFEGAVVTQLTGIFIDTWGKNGDLSGKHFGLPDRNDGGVEENINTRQGQAMCRAIADGPDDNLDKLELVFYAAMDSAQNSIRIMTPYFLPGQGMIAMLQSAALRGLDVSIVLPERNNLPFVHWASRNMLWELLSCGVRVCYQPGFVHTKLLLIDETYALIGSANIDPRSLRLNYELGVEIYDRELVGELIKDFENARRASITETQEALDGRSLLVRTRDALCWLASPYL